MLRSRLAFLVLACALVLYAAFPTRTYYWDGVLFSLNIESAARAKAPAAALLHPNHLLYSVFGFWLYRALSPFALRAIAVLQIANIVASIASASVLYAIARRITQSQVIALFCACLFSFGAIWWKFSTDADPYIVSVLFLLLAFWCMLVEPPRIWLAAAFHIAAMLFHELAVFAYIPLLAVLMLRSRFKTAAAYVISTAACVAAVYTICYSQTDHHAYPSFSRWLTSYASDSGFIHSFGTLLHPYLTSYLKLFAGGKLSLMRNYFSITAVLGYLVCVAAIGTAVAWLRRPANNAPAPLSRDFKIVMWAWFAAFAIFLACFDPGSTFHKLFVWPAIVLLIGIYVPAARAKAFAALSIALAAWNFAAFIYPHSHSSADPVLMLALKIDRELPKSATIIYSAFSPDDWYLDYFAPGRNWVYLSAPSFVLSGSGPVCYETTALEALRPAALDGPKWELVNGQHNIRLECRKPAF